MQYRPKFLSDFTKLAVSIVVAIVVTDLTTQAQANGVAQSAPDFTLPSRDGDNRRLLEERGNIVLVNFWASWCGPCREELPAMEALQQKYQDLGFTVLAVNVDDQPEKANILLDDIKVSFPVLFDSAGEVSQRYDVSAMPTTVFVDRNGLARLTHKGYKSGDENKYEKAIKLLLRE
ncbi:TlpA family protein disulfide reductase [Alteromonas flava]|uniref:TlpA family protein disulfide reductase n=1 Tax=Alteromonas flava TaxID=2048003 RepID=UPI000C289ABF|nr:TlpA disulfide reductase family protein [Alteromonas flava]